MVGTSKVLTVSYGTFSCTLEGFDDPFSTMKMVAEYFRDLSAQDRFFGSEPPTPDVDMLYRIAQSGTPKRVAAEMQENGVVLRQSQEAAAAGLSGTAPAQKAPVQVTPAPHAEAADVEAEAPVAAEAVAVAEDDASATVEPSIVSHAEAADEASAPDDAEPLLEVALDRVEEIAADDVEEAAIAAVDTTEPVEDVTAEEDDYDDADAIFAAIAREDEAQAAPEEFEAETVAAQARIEDDLDDDLAAALAEIEAEARPTPVRATAQAEPLVFHAHVPDDSIARDFEDDLAAALAGADMPEDVAAPASADTHAEHAAALATPEDAGLAPEAAELDDEDESDDDDAGPLRARRGETEEERAERRRQRRDRRERKRREMLGLTDEGTTAGDVAGGQDVDALVHELATLDDASASATTRAETFEADAFEDDEAHNVEDDAAAALAEARRTRAEKALRASDLAREEQAIERLLRSTNARMDRPESTRRANALRQLKAAVAATEAERRAVPGLERIRASRGDAFRADLDLARTDPEISSGPVTPGTARPAPLVLVSEQRIDRSARPAVSRRTESDDASADAMAASGSFAEYAGAIGAESLADLLEAAAAYTSYVEGQPRFSRAQVISKLSDVAGAPDVSREAGLRGFGQLLREGKILRVQDGQFTISKSSRYASQQRSAAG